MNNKKYRVLIADDEGIVIKSLSLIIGREFGDTCLINSAKTGRQVIEIAEEFRPDIVFMDIQMPGINGIQAIKEIQKNNKYTVFIIISAYDKFTYAQEAIGLGVFDYLTKPTNKDEIIETFKRAIDSVDKEREKRSDELKIKEKLETVIPIIENGMIYSILFQDTYPAEIKNFKNLLGIDYNYGYVFIIQYGDLNEKGMLDNPVGTSVKAQGFYPTLKEITKGYFNDGIMGPVMVNQVIVVVPTIESEITYSERANIINKTRKLSRDLGYHIDINFRIGIGDVEKFADLANSYKQATYVLKENNGKVAHIKDISANLNQEIDYPEKAKKDIMAALSAGNLVRARIESEYYIDWMITNFSEKDFNINIKIYETLLYFENKAYQLGVNSYDFINRGNYLDEIIQIQSEEDLKNYFLEKIIKIGTSIIAKKETDISSAIKEAKEYILENYKRDISLDDVAEKIDISPYYFSKLFKEETGENFIDYLTSLRIIKAEELLKNSDISIKEICFEVGYRDPNYFSRIFKKNIGITPTEFRESVF